MTFVTRQEWQTSSQPVTGPARKAATTRTILHYEGTGRSAPISDGAAWCRNGQASYLSSRGYSLGYNFMIPNEGPQNGWVYQIRGEDINNAANKGSKDNPRPGFPYNANDYTRSITIVGNENAQFTPETQAAIRSLMIGTLYGHRDVQATACCGDTYYAQIPALNTDTPTGDDEKMLWIGKKSGTNSHHTADGVQRTYTASPEILIASAVASGKPLKDMGSGRDVKKLTDVSSVSGAVIDAHGFDVG